MLTDREGGPGGGGGGRVYLILLMVFAPPPPGHPLLDRAFLTRFSIFYNVLDWQKGKKSKQ